MSEAKHTPGPWSIDGGGSVISSDAVTDLAILNMANPRFSWGGSDFSTKSHREANARLIAAAPELLDALRFCAAVCAGEIMHKQGLIDALEKARSAIAKATGLAITPAVGKEG